MDVSAVEEVYSLTEELIHEDGRVAVENLAGGGCEFVAFAVEDENALVNELGHLRFFEGVMKKEHLLEPIEGRSLRMVAEEKRDDLARLCIVRGRRETAAKFWVHGFEQTLPDERARCQSFEPLEGPLSAS